MAAMAHPFQGIERRLMADQTPKSDGIALTGRLGHQAIPHAGDSTSTSRDALDSGFGFRRVTWRALLPKAITHETGDS
jgi:hypothetical protein